MPRMDKSDRKKVLIPRDLINSVLSEGPQEFVWNGEKIVVTEEDIPYESPKDCCFRSAYMLDGSGRGEELCHNCGRVFNVVDSTLERFDETHADEEVVVYIPRKEFLDED